MTMSGETPVIRRAGFADVEPVRDIVDAAYRSYIPRIGKPPGPMLDDYAKRISDGQVWVLAGDGGIVGILVLEETPKRFLLDNIAVAPGQQGKGHGRVLLDFAEAEASRRGWHEIRLYTHVLMTENIALYRRIGYVETGRVTERGFDRVYMAKHLAVTPGNEGRLKNMPTLEVIGAPQSNFVRTVRMACAEKSVPYTLNAVFPHTPEVDAIHPFGKIPAMRHGDVTLAETKAICSYIDMAFDGPPLIPRDPVGAAKTEQWISLINTGFDIVFARQYLVAYFFSGLPDGAPDRAKIDAVLPKLQEMFGILDRELGLRPYLAGAEFTLADMFLLPLIHYLNLMPESGEMLKGATNLGAWFARVSARPSAQATVPPPMPKRE